MLGTNYSYFVVFAMKFLTFADLFFFFLWKTWRAEKGLLPRGRSAQKRIGGRIGNGAAIRVGGAP
jgi:hypothetical protein